MSTLSQTIGKSILSVREPRSVTESNYEFGIVYKNNGGSICSSTRPQTYAKDVNGDYMFGRKNRKQNVMNIEVTDKENTFLEPTKVQELEKNCIEQVTVARNYWNELLRIQGRILGRKGTILIDSGAQDNFVSKGFVNHLHARTKTLKDVSRVMLPDGCGVKDYLPKATIKVCGGYVDNVDLKVVSI